MFARLMAVVIVLAGTGAEAQTEGNQLDGITSVYLRLGDEVSGGCWPQPKETRKEVELELIRSKISTPPTDTRMPTMLISIVGKEYATGSCLARYDLDVFVCLNLKLPFNQKTAFKCPSIWVRGGTSVGPKGGFQAQITKQMLVLVRKFLYDLEMDRLGKKPK